MNHECDVELCNFEGPHKHCVMEVVDHSRRLLPEYQPSSEDSKKRLTEEEIEFRSEVFLTVGGCLEPYTEDDERWERLGEALIPGDVCPWCAMEFNEIPIHTEETLIREDLSHLGVSNHSMAEL